MTPEVARAAQARYARVQAAMARRGVGALLLATPHLATFASGARRVQVAGSGGSLPWVVLRAGAPAAVVFTTDPDGAPPWMPPACVEPLRWDARQQLDRIAVLLGETSGAIACDVWSAATVALAGQRPLVDAAPLLAEAAAPRTDGEVDLIVRALAAARRGLDAACAALRVGTRVMDVLAAALATMSETGAGFPLATPRIWRRGEVASRLPATARFAASDVVTLELGLWLAGHVGVAGTTVAADGRDLSAVRRRWDTALCALAKRCRAGATTADVRQAAVAAGAGEEGLLAHGLGVGVEPPFVHLRRDDAHALAAGTVLLLAPSLVDFRATRALLVTNGAPRWLEPAP